LVREETTMRGGQAIGSVGNKITGCYIPDTIFIKHLQEFLKLRENFGTELKQNKKHHKF